MFCCTEINETIYGLAAYFYSREVARILRVSEGLEAGLVGVNDAAVLLIVLMTVTYVPIVPMALVEWFYR